MGPVPHRIARIAPELILRTILIAWLLLFLDTAILLLFDLSVPAFAWAVPAVAFWIPMTIGLYRRADRHIAGRRGAGSTAGKC